MSHVKKICFDKILPSELLKPFPERRVELARGNARAVFFVAKLWPNGSRIKIGFLGGNAQQHDMVKSIAPKWTDYANLTFDFTEVSEAQVRITFADDGAWSYVGTDALNISPSQATMNYGWLDQSVILHEFGHMLGMVHEHQNPIDNPIQWNREQVIEDLSGPPNYWDLPTIEHNIFERYSQTQINGSTFDPDSIMLYEFPASWTLNGVSTHSNDDLSELDRAFARMVYPPETEGPVELPVLTGTKGTIGQAGEEDLYTFTIVDTGTYTIETRGESDLVMTLYGPNDQMLAQNDDSGVGRNPRISRALEPGTYKVQVRHYNRSAGTGEYLISVMG